MNFQIFKLDLEKAEEPEIKWLTSTGHQTIEKARKLKKKKNPSSASLTTLKSLTMWITTECSKVLKTFLKNLEILKNS